ncbi:hypothetical protein AV654_15000 [Paenibacillus elgii]|uniref:Copper amine oxidase-like N-terminal domain-containing protein n=1 Tax=Paenibacillus elgii TaxID=189691 RepID=A0A163YLP3_9BACL|nr:YbhB/YbcL family Raf kinase inhibitor-like protein [Paenibacillus elgii]KZE79608.1 hypothetical protein AV654_15000 [Paenibacillus elgii]
MTMKFRYSRNLLAGGLVMALFMPAVSTAAEKTVSAASTKDVMRNVASYTQWNTPFTVVVNGKKLETKGEMINTRMLVPVREVFEAAGAVVTWDSSEQAWQAEGKGMTARQKLGEKKAIVNGVAYELDQEAVLENGNAFVSARLVEAALGLELRWDSAERVLSASAKPAASGFRVWSDAFREYGTIPVQYAHEGVVGGQNISLPVGWEGVPEGTKSFAVVMYDVHPIADNFVHWSVLNIPVTDNGLSEGAAGHLKNGAVELNGYYGMEPPRYSGDHLYRIAVYALDTDKLEAPAQAPTFFEELEPLLRKHSLGYAETDGFFRQ